MSADKRNSTVSTSSSVCSPAPQTSLIRALPARFSCSTVGLKVNAGRALPVKPHTCFILLSRKQPTKRRRDLCHRNVSTSESNLLQFLPFFCKSQRQMTPFPRHPVRPAAGGSESHFLAPPLKVPLQARHTNRKEPSFMSPDLHAAHVKARDAGRCARVSWSGLRCRILSLCCFSCHLPKNKNREDLPHARASGQTGQRRQKV